MSNSQQLIQLVLGTSFVIPDSWQADHALDAYTWCKRMFGEERGGNIMQEAEEGWLDYSDGHWCMCWYETKVTWVFWFSNRSRLAQFTLTWG
jgi:hypothetical protein